MYSISDIECILMSVTFLHVLHSFHYDKHTFRSGLQILSCCYMMPISVPYCQQRIQPQACVHRLDNYYVAGFWKTNQIVTSVHFIAQHSYTPQVQCFTSLSKFVCFSRGHFASLVKSQLKDWYQQRVPISYIRVIHLGSSSL